RGGFGARDDGRPGRNQRDAGEDEDRSNRTTTHCDAGAGAHGRAAARGEGLRAAALGTNIISCMNSEIIWPSNKGIICRFDTFFCEGRASCTSTNACVEPGAWSNGG